VYIWSSSLRRKLPISSVLPVLLGCTPENLFSIESLLDTGSVEPCLTDVPLVELAADVGLAVQRTRRVQETRTFELFLSLNALNGWNDGRITGSAFMWKEITGQIRTQGSPRQAGCIRDDAL
jgi:hypothetical protein